MLLLGQLASAALLLAVLADGREEFYSSRYDDLDVRAILENDKLREQYYECFLGTRACVTPEAKFFKGLLPEAFVTKCKKCTDKQKEKINIIAEWYSEKQPDKWTTLIKKCIDKFKNKMAPK